MASQTLIFSSSLAPKLATFNSRSTTLPQLALPKSPRALNYCSSSLPTPSLHLKPFNFKSDFKCKVAPADEHATLVPGAYEPIPGVEHNEYVQGLGQFAVDEENKKLPDAEKITFMRVVEAEQQVVAGMNYRLWIQGAVQNVDLVFKFKALVFVGLPVCPKKLESFEPVVWAKSK